MTRYQPNAYEKRRWGHILQLYGLLAGYQADSLSNIVGWPLSIEGKYLQIVDQLILPEITISSDIKHCFMLYFRTKYNIRPATAESELNIHIHMFLVFIQQSKRIGTLSTQQKGLHLPFSAVRNQRAILIIASLLRLAIRNFVLQTVLLMILQFGFSSKLRLLEPTTTKGILESRNIFFFCMLTLYSSCRFRHRLSFR